ncbi:hypothetical protein RhiirB3_447606 [Rhizophagus irregularis]|nr:hypothetical protein RhiirB3_447606 [Rhizophagus irregularis]
MIIIQFPNLPSDPSLYFKDDINTLRNTLQRFIPYIKFFNLNYNKFLTKIYPYRTEEILSKDLQIQKPKITKEIRPVSSIDSKIITIQHAELISRWIDKLRVTDKTKNVYEFNLIFRGIGDGFSPSKFYEICDNKYHTISIIKVKDSDEILGGYNPET